MSLTESLFLICIILLILDIIVTTDILTFIAYTILAILFFLNINVTFAIRILFTLLLLFGFICFHYLIWRRYVFPFINSKLAPEKLKSGADELIGQVAVIKVIDNVKMVMIFDALYNFKCTEPLNEGDTVKVVSYKNSLLLVKKQ